VALVPQLVNSLDRDDALEQTQAVCPVGISKTALHKLDTSTQRTEPLDSKLVHRGREIHRDIGDRGKRVE
jgi:hypothetical protein